MGRDRQRKLWRVFECTFLGDSFLFLIICNAKIEQESAAVERIKKSLSKFYTMLETKKDAFGNSVAEKDWSKFEAETKKSIQEFETSLKEKLGEDEGKGVIESLKSQAAADDSGTNAPNLQISESPREGQAETDTAHLERVVKQLLTNKNASGGALTDDQIRQLSQEKRALKKKLGISEAQLNDFVAKVASEL